MLIFKSHYFFMKPVWSGNEGVDFEVYSADGLLIGNASSSFENLSLLATEDRAEFEEFVQNQAIEMEAKLKFQREYGVPIEQASSLSCSAVDVLNTMESKWGVPINVIDALLGDSL